MDSGSPPNTMLGYLFEKFQKHYLRIVLIIALLATGVLSAAALLLPHSREIVYEMHTVFATCLPSGSNQCAARMELLIGNTGSALEFVNLTWPRVEGGWSSSHNVLNISADNRRSREPSITCANSAGRQECRIEQFAPGALVILHMDCYQCSLQQVQWLAETPLTIQTEAHAAHGDPRMTVFLRRLLVLAELF